MKKRILSIFLCLVMVFSLLPFTASAAGATPIDEKNFPDPVFREYVRKVAGSTYLNDTIVRQIEALDVSKDNIQKVLGDRDPITSLKGIRHLKYVRDLNCKYQKLTTLDLELNMRVERLNCYGNQLTDLWLRPTGTSLKYLNCSVNKLNALDLSKSSELTELYCNNSKLTALDLSANKKLQIISATSNNLTTLDVRNLPELTYLDLQANYDLKSIDVSKNTKLEKLNLAQTGLTSLNVKNNRKLVELKVHCNQLTALDVSSNYLLKELACFENQLTALDLSSNISLEYLGVSENPIAELDLHPLRSLQTLYCQKMQLKKLDVDRCPELQLLYCYDNQIETLDLRSNKKLQALQCQNNRLSWLDLSSNTALDPAKVDCSGNVYGIEVDRNLQYKVYPDLPCYGATEGTYFTAARASDWTGGTVSKVDGWDVLTLDNARVKEVTYKYDTGNAEIGKVAFTLKTEVPAAYVISSAALTVQSPVEGESAANPTVTTDSGAKYVVERADWRVNGSMTVYTGTFEKGKSYTLNLLLAPKSGYHFADSESMQVTVNGQKAEKVLPYKGGKLIVTATFTVKNLVTISFDPNGGTGTMQPMRVKAEVGYALPECTFTPPEGKEFAGWLTVNGKVLPAGTRVISSIDQTLKATWKDKEAAEITITFDPNGGTGTMKPMRVKAGENYTLPECTFTPPEGREFAGWLAVNGTVYPAGTKVISSYDQSFKATWKDKEAAEVTISFDPNGGTGTMQPMKVKSGENFTLPECTFTPPEGKEFAGWLAANGTVYPAGDIAFSTTDSVLKATWKDKEAAEITISFDPNGGTGTMQPMKVKSGENFTLPECTFTPPEGKEFAGWLAANGNVYPAGDIVFSTTDSVLKATWKDKEAETPHKHSYKAVVTAPTCTEQGYTTHTCACGDSYVDTYVDALGHAWDNGKVTKEPTETETGVKTFTCTRCGETKTETIPKLTHEHSYKDVVTAPTCTAKGYTTHTCACGDSYVDTYVDALGHAWDSGKVTKQPTATEAGIRTYTCTRCGETKTETISATGCPSAGFTDVPGEDNWAHAGIDYCVANGLMSGIGNNLFGPKLTTTRAQIVQILYNLEGEPKVSGTTPFTDLTQDWYQDAVLWAYQTGVVAGTSSTTFEPDLPVTREQIAVILMEYMTRVLKLERTWTPADLSIFPDADSVSDWAKDAMADAVGLGLISGASNGGQTLLEPQGSATREQVATILMEFCKNVKK